MACFQYDDARLVGMEPSGAKMPFAEPGVEPHYAPSWTFRVTHAHVVLHLFPEEQRWSGHTTFTLEALPTWRGEATFDLDGPTVTAVTDEAGSALDHRTEDGKLVVVAGDARTLVVAFEGRQPAAGLYFTGPAPHAPERDPMAWTQCQDEDAHFFMPCLDHPRIKHPWTIELTGPAGHTLLSNGAEAETGERDGRAWARFEQAEPMPAYLFVAVSGPLEATTTAWRDVPVRYLVPRGEGEPVARTFGKTPEMMEVFSTFTGVDYAWPRYDQVVVHEFVFGGMENTACTVMTDVLLVDERTLPHWDPEGLVSHELAHQWFGDLVTCQDWSQAWLNESWATFMETVWHEHVHGTHETAWYAFGQMASYLSEDGGRYRRPIQSYRFREPIDVFDRHLYEKGAVVMRTLRHALGEEAFRAGVTHYLTRHAHGVVHGRDFIRAMEDATGTNLDRFVHQWIEGAGHPVLEVSLGKSDGLVTIGVKQTQQGDRTCEAFHVGLHLELVLADGTRRALTLPVQERERAWAVPIDDEVTAVRVDPGFRMLAEVKLSGPHAWLAEAAADDCPVLATRALRALAKVNDAASVAVIRTQLAEHGFWGVRGEAARLLGERAGASSRDALLAALETEREPRVISSIAKALGSFREADVADALLVRLEAGTPTWYVQGDLLEALGATRDPRAVDAIRPQLAVSCVGEVVRGRALMGLAKTQRAEALDVILGFLDAPRSDREIGLACKALGQLGAELPDEAVRKGCREALEAQVRDGGFRTKLMALGALGQLRDGAAAPLLQQVHASDPDGRVRRTAWEALVKVREGRTTDEGLKSLRGRLEALEAENAKLRERVDRLDRVDAE